MDGETRDAIISTYEEKSILDEWATADFREITAVEDKVVEHTAKDVEKDDFSEIADTVGRKLSVREKRRIVETLYNQLDGSGEGPYEMNDFSHDEFRNAFGDAIHSSRVILPDTEHVRERIYDRYGGHKIERGSKVIPVSFVQQEILDSTVGVCIDPNRLYLCQLSSEEIEAPSGLDVIGGGNLSASDDRVKILIGRGGEGGYNLYCRVSFSEFYEMSPRSASIFRLPDGPD